MRAYFEDLHLEDLRVDDALRAFVGSFRLSGEAGYVIIVSITLSHVIAQTNVKKSSSFFLYEITCTKHIIF